MGNSPQRPLPPNTPVIGSTWKHYKGDLYWVVLVTVDEVTDTILIHYWSEKGRSLGWVPWTRKLEVWHQLVPAPNGPDQPRFQEVKGGINQGELLC